MDIAGKKIVFLGDSITEGVGVTDQENRYDRRIAREYGVITVNCGISGTRLAHQHKASDCPRFDLCFCGRTYDLDKDADIIVVFGGTNDYGHGDADFGLYGDKTPATFCGAAHFLMNNLCALYPNAKIVIMTPCHRENDAKPTAPGKKVLVDYVDELVKEAKDHNVTLIDLYRTLPIDPNDPVQKTEYANDGLHLNDKGHGLLAEVLMKTLKTL